MKFLKSNKKLLTLSILQTNGWASFLFPIWYFFYTQTLGMSPQQSTLFLMISFVFQLIFEVPTGVIADVKGRMFSYRLGLFLSLISILPVFITKDFRILILTCVVNGLGLAMTSGCLAPITHSVFMEMYPDDKPLQDKALRMYNSKLHAFLFVFRAICVLLGGFLYTISPFYPIAALALFTLFIFICSMIINIKVDNKKSSKKLHKEDVLNFLKNNSNVTSFLILSGILAMLLNAGWEMFSPLFGTDNLNYIQLGLFFAALSLVSVLFPLISGSMINKFGHKVSIVLSLTFSLLSVIIMGHLAYPFNLLVIISISAASGPLNVITNSYIQTHSPNSIQSTILSISSALAMTFSFAIVQLDGWLLTRYSPLDSVKMLVLPVLVIYLIGLFIMRKI